MPTVTADFNGDGFSDLAIGVPGENNSAGAVNVIYGSATGLSASGALANQLWSQNSAGIADESEALDQFGFALAAGDFNGDGFADLAVGVPGEDVVLNETFFTNVGRVHVLYGSANGLNTAGSQVWDQNTPTAILGLYGDGDLFGAALAVGDFNNDGFDDLAVGIPGEDLGVIDDSGAVIVIYGSSSGLTAEGNQFWHQSIEGVIGVSEDGDLFGFALAAGDFNRDGIDDLAIGVPGEKIGAVGDNAGAVNVLYGSVNRLTAAGNQFWAQGSGGIVDQAEAGDNFGKVLAVGDFNGDLFADLAIGVPLEDLLGNTDAGAVAVLYGRPGGLSSINNQIWTQNTFDIAGSVVEAGDQFGAALAAGDFNNDDRDDLAVGTPREDFNNITNGGLVQVIFGGPVVLLPSGSQFLHQGLNGIEDSFEAFDLYGAALGAGDFDNNGFADLAVGVPEENGSGAVNVLYGMFVQGGFGGFTGLTATNDQIWTQNSPGILDTAEIGDHFGAALSGSTTSGGAGFSGQWRAVTQPGGGHQQGQARFVLQGELEVTNPGVLSTTTSVIRFYLSDDATLDDGDVLLGEEQLAPLGPGQRRRVHFRARLQSSASGKYLIAVLDATNVVDEVDEANNIVVFGPIA